MDETSPDKEPSIDNDNSSKDPTPDFKEQQKLTMK